MYLPEMRAFMGEKLPRIHAVVPSEMPADLAAAIELIRRDAFVFEKADASHDTDLTESKGSLSEKVDLDTALGQLLDLSGELDSEAAEFVKEAMASGFDVAVESLKKKVGL